MWRNYVMLTEKNDFAGKMFPSMYFGETKQFMKDWCIIHTFIPKFYKENLAKCVRCFMFYHLYLL